MMSTEEFVTAAYKRKWNDKHIGRSVKRNAMTIGAYLAWRSDVDRTVEAIISRCRPEPTVTDRFLDWLYKPRQTRKG